MAAESDSSHRLERCEGDKAGISNEELGNARYGGVEEQKRDWREELREMTLLHLSCIPLHTDVHAGMVVEKKDYSSFFIFLNLQGQVADKSLVYAHVHVHAHAHVHAHVHGPSLHRSLAHLHSTIFLFFLFFFFLHPFELVAVGCLLLYDYHSRETICIVCH